MKNFVYFESLENGMYVIEGIQTTDDLSTLLDWLRKEEKEEKEEKTLIKWIETAKIGQKCNHKFGCLIRLIDCKEKRRKKEGKGNMRLKYFKERRKRKNKKTFAEGFDYAAGAILRKEETFESLNAYVHASSDFYAFNFFDAGIISALEKLKSIANRKEV